MRVSPHQHKVHVGGSGVRVLGVRDHPPLAILDHREALALDGQDGKASRDPLGQLVVHLSRLADVSRHLTRLKGHDLAHD